MKVVVSVTARATNAAMKMANKYTSCLSVVRDSIAHPHTVSGGGSMRFARVSALGPPQQHW